MENIIIADNTHPDFINEDGTSRIMFIWDQNIEGKPPQGFAIGTEYTRGDINRALAAESDAARYEIVAQRDTNGHGTAVAGIAAGNGRAPGGAPGAAPKATIIAVKLASNQSKYFTRSTDVMRAMKYAVDRAKEANMPVAINLSFGTNDGSHIGKTLFEQFIDEISGQWSTAMVIASGNEGYARHHYRNVVTTNETDEVEFTVGQGITTLSLIIWKAFTDDLDFEVLSPDGTTSGVIVGTGQEEHFILGNTRVTFILGQPTPYFSDQAAYIELNGINGREIPASLWRLRVRGRNVVEGHFDIWLPITEVVGLDTAFIRPSVETTLTIPSSSEMAITVSGYNSVDGSFADFSGRGSTRDDIFIKPDIAAPAVNIQAPTTGGGYASFTGTSFAAPHVCGGAALLMQWGIVLKNDVYLYGQRLKAYLRQGAVRSIYTSYPNMNWGFGRLCIKNSLDSLIRYSYLNGGVNRTPQLSERFLPFADASVSTNGNGVDAQAKISYVSRESAGDNTGGPDLVYSMETPPAPATPQTEAANPVTDPSFIDVVIFYNQNSADELRKFPEIYISSILANKYAIVHLPAERAQELENSVFIRILWELPAVCGLLDRASMEASGITAVQKQPFLDLSGNGTLVGIIDTGIDFTLEAFKYEDGTSKIAFLWDQSIEGEGPAMFSYGAEYTNQQINEALTLENPLSAVPSRDEIGHGTFLASLAAGRDDGAGGVGAAPNADLIVVKLKKAKSSVMEGELIPDDLPGFQSTDVMAALEYIYTKSVQLGKPVSICLGIGTNNGAHDGYSFFERYISEMSVMNRMALIAAVGNEGNLSHHVYGKLTNGSGPYVMELRVGQNERGFILNLWASAPDRISVSITSPVGSVVQRLQYGTEKVQRASFILEKTQIEIRYTFPSLRNGDQLVYISFKDPTPGLWEISVYGDLVLDGRFHAWLPIAPFIERDTAFLSSSAQNTATIPATANGVISVGAYNAADKSIYISSSRGPSISGLQCPDLCAPGVNVGGLYPMGQTGIMSGTSVSAAIVAGAAALILEWGIVKNNDPSINSLKMRSYLIQGCTQRQGILYPDDLWGYGELNLIQSFERIRSRGSN